MKELPQQLQEIMGRMRAGETREQIAIEQGISVSALDQRFRRRGYYWGEWCNRYVEGNSLRGQFVINGVLLPERAVQVIVQFKNVKADTRQIASRLRFANKKEMDEYMESLDLYWVEERHTYLPYELLH